MPAIWERLVKQLKQKGVKNPYAVATSQLQKAGDLKKGTRELTPQGQHRDSIGPAGRAKERAARYSEKNKPGDYKFDSKSNMATLSKRRGRK